MSKLFNLVLRSDWFVGVISKVKQFTPCNKKTDIRISRKLGKLLEKNYF